MTSIKPPASLESQGLLNSSRFQGAKRELLGAIIESSRNLRGVKPSSQDADVRARYQEFLKQFNHDRGRELYFPFLASGLGSGPFVELLDGSVKLDLITGIGINFFGHSHPQLIAESIEALSSDLMQGNLEPGYEAPVLLRALLDRVGPSSKIRNGWITCSGTMANEIALKIIRQKKSPATKILAFESGFAGRSTAMQEITDNPKYREGQPVYGEVEYLPFFDPKLGLPASIEKASLRMSQHLSAHPGKFAALMMELVQGEGGFRHAPREFYTAIFDQAKKAGLAVWADEVQTFGRTGELFAFQTFELAEFIDVVTVGKMLQACAVLFSPEYNPKPGLVAGTFTGSTAALRVARRSIELLHEEGLLGKSGKIQKLSERFVRGLEKLKNSGVGEIRAIGGMIAFQPHGGSLDEVRRLLLRLFDRGAVAFYCGHDPYLVRMLPPLGAMTEADVDLACDLIAQALPEVRS